MRKGTDSNSAAERAVATISAAHLLHPAMHFDHPGHAGLMGAAGHICDPAWHRCLCYARYDKDHRYGDRLTSTAPDSHQADPRAQRRAAMHWGFGI